MSTLTEADKQYLQRILEMGDGYVLGFTDSTFAQFFNRYRIDIHGPSYRTHGNSKAKKMRAFWERESDTVVAPILRELFDVSEARRETSGHALDDVLLQRCRGIVARISGKVSEVQSTTAAGFLSQDFEIPSIDKLPVEPTASAVIQDRIREAQRCLTVDAHLSAILMCGSVLEAVLLGAALKDPEKFNRSDSSPKRNGKVKPLTDWRLSEFIDVAYKTGLLRPDVQKFSHGLRDFRNYIHPYEQMASGFKPDSHTAKLCFQALKAALADLAGER